MDFTTNISGLTVAIGRNIDIYNVEPFDTDDIVQGAFTAPEVRDYATQIFKIIRENHLKGKNLNGKISPSNIFFASANGRFVVVIDPS